MLHHIWYMYSTCYNSTNSYLHPSSEPYNTYLHLSLSLFCPVFRNAPQQPPCFLEKEIGATSPCGHRGPSYGIDPLSEHQSLLLGTFKCALLPFHSTGCFMSFRAQQQSLPRCSDLGEVSPQHTHCTLPSHNMNICTHTVY